MKSFFHPYTVPEALPNLSRLRELCLLQLKKTPLAFFEEEDIQAVQASFTAATQEHLNAHARHWHEKEGMPLEAMAGWVESNPGLSAITEDMTTHQSLYGGSLKWVLLSNWLAPHSVVALECPNFVTTMARQALKRAGALKSK